MPRTTVDSAAASNSAEIEYDTFGDPGDPALLLVMGFTAQLIAWDEAFCRRLADAGRYVIRYDNRDCGLSTHYDGQEVNLSALMGALLSGDASELESPYRLSDMAADGISVLDALGIEMAHVVGASMGGMIVQTMAIEHPQRLRTMTSIMSSTGERDYGQASPTASQALFTPPPADRDAFMERSATLGKIICSPRYFDPDKAKKRAGEAFDRAFYPEGATRQLAAIVTSGDRGEALPEVRTPTLVIHGRADTLIDVSGGVRTAELIPSANLLVLNDMGHDLPEPLWPIVCDAIVSHTTHEIR